MNIRKSENIALSVDYAKLLTELKARISSAQLRAAQAANTELISLYWNIGEQIKQQKESQWGSKLIEKLSFRGVIS